MIPTSDENGLNSFLANEQMNIYRIQTNLISSCSSNLAACAEDAGNQVTKKCQLFSSRTDKPRLAHEVYWYWLSSVGSFDSDSMTCNRTTTFPSKKSDLLNAAYSGASLMYRK